MAKSDEQVINVSMTLNTKGFTDGAVLTSKQATALGKSLSSALTLDNKSAINSLKGINSELANVKTTALSLKSTLRDTFNFSNKQNLNNLKAIAKEMGALKDTSVSAAKAVASVKFLIGDSNKNIKSVISNLERLEKVAKRVGSVNVGVSNSGGTRSSGGSSRTTAASTSSTFIPTIGNQVTEAKSVSKSVSKPYVQGKATFIPESYFEANGTGLKQLNQGSASKQAAIAGEAAAKEFSKGFAKVNKYIEDQGNEVFRSFSRIFSASFLADALADTFIGMVKSLQKLSTETAIYAARTEELGVVLTSLARINNISTQTVVQQEVAVKRLNITTQDARETLARFINVGFDLNKAGPLARVAQDLAVIEGLSTSAELEKLIVGIQTLQSRNLRSAGVYLTVDEVLDKLSATTGRARDSFSTLEKQTAVLNAVLEYGAKAAGTYDEAMETTSKQLRSMERYFYEAQNAVGKGLIPALAGFVTIGTEVLKLVTLMPNSFLGLINTIGLLTGSLILLKTTAAQSIIGGLGSALANTGRAITGSGGGVSSLSTEQRINVAQLKTQREELAIRYKNRLEKKALIQEEMKSLANGRKSNFSQQEELKLRQLNSKLARTQTGIGRTESQLAGINATIGRGGLSKTDAFVGFLGKAGLIATGVTAIYQLVSGINEYKNSLYQLSAVDMSAVTKYQKDLERIAKDQQLLSSGKDLTGKDAIEITSRLTSLSRGRLQGEIRSLDVNKNITQELRTQLATQLQLEKEGTQSKLETKKTEALSQIRKSQENVSAVVKDIDAITEAEEKIRKSLGTNVVPRANIGALSKGMGLTNGFFNGIISNILGQTEGDKAKAVANDSIALDNFQGQSLVLFEMQDKLSELSKTSDEQFQARRQSITDFLKISQQMGDVNPLAAFEGPNPSIALTKKQLEEVRNELEDIRKELRQEDWDKVQKFIGDPTVNTFNTFQEQFDKQRATREKSFRQIITERALETGWDKNEVEKRIQQQLGLADSGFLTGQLGKEALQALEAQVAQQLVIDRAGGKSSSASGVLQSQFSRLYETNREGNIKNPGGTGVSLKAAIKQMRAQSLAKKEAEEAMAEFLEASLTEQASSKLRKILEKPIPDQYGAFNIDNFSKGIEDFVSKSMSLGDTSASIEKTRSSLAKLFATDGQKATESLRQQNVLLQERENLKKANEAFTDANNSELQRIKNLVKIKQAETEIAELKQNLQLPVINSQLLAEKQLLELTQKRREEEQQLVADISIEMVRKSSAISSFSKGVAQVYLERQRASKETDDNAIKAYASLQFAQGNEGLFSDNRYIQAASEQADRLASIEKNGGVMGQKVDVTNKILEITNKQSVSNTASIQESIRNASLEIKGSVASIPNLAMAMPRSTVGGSGNFGGGTLSAKYANAYQSFANAGVNPNAAKFYGAISAVEGGGNVMFGGRPYDPSKFQHPGQYVPKSEWRSGNMGPSSAAGPLQITVSNWIKATKSGLINGDFSNLSNHIKVARALSAGRGGGARTLNAIDSGDFQTAMALGGGKDWQAVPGTHLGGKQNQGFFNLLGMNPVDTQSVQVQAKQKAQEVAQQAAIAARNNADTLNLARNNSDLLANALGNAGISKEEFESVNKPTKNANGTIGYGGANVAEIVSSIGLLGKYKQAFGTVSPNDDQKEAFTTYTKEREDFISERRKQLAKEMLENVDLDQLRYEVYYNERKSFDAELEHEKKFGFSQRQAQLDVIDAKSFDLENKSGAFYSKTIGEADVARAEAYLETLSGITKLEREREVRGTTEGRAKYEADQARKFYAEQLQQANNLQDEELHLQLRIRAYRDETSEYTKNILKRENTERLTAEQEVLENIDKLNRDAINSRYGLEGRLLQRQAEINLAKSKEYENMLLRQIDVENELARKSDLFDADEFRTRGLEKISGVIKDSTTLMSDLFSDTFDSISNGFGGLVDKMTEKMGLFGGVVGNLLKGIFNNVTGTISKNLLDSIFPSAIPTSSGTGGLLSGILSTVTGGDVSSANDSASNSVIRLAEAAGIAASALLGIAGNAGSTILSAGGIVASGISRISGMFAGGRGASAGAGGARSGGLLSGIAGNISNLGGVIGNGIGAIGSTTSSLGGFITPDFNPASPKGNFGLSIGTIRAQAGFGGVASQAGSTGLGGITKGLNLKGIGQSLLSSAPFIGAGLGGMLGGGSGLGGFVGQAGGLLGGVAGLGLAGALGIGGGGLFAAGGIMSSIFGTGLAGGIGGTGLAGSIGSAFGLGGTAATAAAATVILAPIAAALLIGAFFINRSKKRREEEKIRNQAMLEALPALEDLLKQVKTDKIDGTEALTRADEIRKTYIEQMSQLKDKKTRNIALKDVSRLDAVISQIKVAAANQKVRRETNDRIVPTYATGGVGNGLIRVSQGEHLYIPSGGGNVHASHLMGAGIPGFSSGGMYTGLKIKGSFDGKDNILASVPKGTVIANPRQVQKIRQSRGYASGGVQGHSGVPTAQGNGSVQPPSVTVIIAIGEEEAAKLGAMIPGSIIVNKIRKDIKKNGQGGLVADIIGTL